MDTLEMERIVVREKKVEYGENAQVRLTITVGKDDIKQQYDELVEEYCQTVQIKGFRKGRVPPAVLIRKFAGSLLGETAERVIKKSLEEAMEDEEKKPLPYSIPTLVGDDDGDGNAEVDTETPTDSDSESSSTEQKKTFSFEEDYTFTIAYDTYPEVALGEYTGIEIEEPQCEITDEDLGRELEQLQQQNALVVEKTEGAIETGDIITIDYCELDESGAEVEASKREGFVFEVGTGYNIYELDEDVVGMEKDSEKVIEKSFAEDSQNSDLAGKSVKIKVSVSAIKVKDLPDIDDELAQDISEKFETLDDLKQDISRRLEESLRVRVRDRLISQIMDKLIETSTVPVPKSMLDYQLGMSWQRFVAQMRGDEAAADRFLEATGRSRESLVEEWTPDATKSLVSSLIVGKIMDQERFETTDEDVEKRIGEIATRQAITIEEARERVESEDLANALKGDIRHTKLYDFLIENAKTKKGAKTTYLDLVGGN